MITFSPAAKILLYILFITAVFLSDSLSIDIVLLILVLVFTIRVPASVLTKGLIPIIMFLVFTFLSNVMFQSGRVIYEIWGVEVTEEGLSRGGHLTFRLFILIMGAKILTATTPAEDLVEAMTRLLGPVGRWRPVREFILTMSLALRFLPIIYDEAQILYRENVKNSSETTLMGKIKLFSSLLAPLFEKSKKRAEDLQEKDRGRET
ncbi:MAG: energy-coupling factor transporter transmembrane component T [Thermodesulfovibrionia bacterium]